MLANTLSAQSRTMNRRHGALPPRRRITESQALPAASSFDKVIVAVSATIVATAFRCLGLVFRLPPCLRMSTAGYRSQRLGLDRVVAAGRPETETGRQEQAGGRQATKPEKSGGGGTRGDCAFWSADPGNDSGCFPASETGRAVRHPRNWTPDACSRPAPPGNGWRRRRAAYVRQEWSWLRHPSQISTAAGGRATLPTGAGLATSTTGRCSRAAHPHPPPG